MKKKILAVIGIIVIAAALFGCSKKTIDVDTKSTEPASQSTAAASTIKPTASTTNTVESSTASTTAGKRINSSTTTTKTPAARTTSEQTARSETTAAPEATKSSTKATTKTTTKATSKPTVKNVSASEVQAQVNSYIRSRGITVDSSLNSGNSGWSGEIAGEQMDLNNGYSLKTCKAYVDMEIASLGKDISMYCYYSNNTFYVCYM